MIEDEIMAVANLRDLFARWSSVLNEALELPLPDFSHEMLKLRGSLQELRKLPDFRHGDYQRKPAVAPLPPQAMTVHEFDSRQAEINTKCDRSMIFYQKALSKLANSGEDYAFELGQYEFWKQRKEDDTADLMQEFVRLHRAAKKAA